MHVDTQNPLNLKQSHFSSVNFIMLSKNHKHIKCKDCNFIFFLYVYNKQKIFIYLIRFKNENRQYINMLRYLKFGE
jgi:hypothetical protein